MQLNVRVVEARGLAKMDTFGKSDPYTILRIVDAPSSFKTSVIKNSLTPVWNEQFKFSVYNPGIQVLSLLVRDEDLAADEDMATLDLQLASLPLGAVVDQWYELRPVKGVKVGGQIHLILHIGLPSSPPFVQWLFPPPTPPPYAFNLRIISADRMEKMDVIGKTDPYFIIKCGGQTLQTSVKNNTLTPRYDEDFQLFVNDPGGVTVKLQLRDKDVAFDDDIGSCELLTSIFPFGIVIDSYIELRAAKKVKRGGRVRVLLQVAAQAAVPFVPGGLPPQAQPVVVVVQPPPVEERAVEIIEEYIVVEEDEGSAISEVKPPGTGNPVKSWALPWGYNASSQYFRDQRFVQHLFGDDDDDEFWSCDGTSVKGQWVEAKYNAPICFTWLAMKARIDSDVEQSPRKFVIEGIINKDTYVKLAVIKTPRWDLGEERLFNFANDQAFRAYRIVFKKSNSRFVALSKVRFGSE
jgi:hypothetical protein